MKIGDFVLVDGIRCEIIGIYFHVTGGGTWYKVYSEDKELQGKWINEQSIHSSHLEEDKVSHELNRKKNRN